MSHLHSILNPESSRRHAEMLSVEIEPVDNLSSSAEDDISPASDDEIDELDEESEEEDYDDSHEEPPPSPTVAETVVGPSQPSPPNDQQGNNADRRDDPTLNKAEGKRPQPAPRRRLEKHDRKIDLGLHDHKAHADCPDTLACLPDTAGRPQHTLPVILRCAILGSPRKRLTIREIYATMESKYPYYKTAGQTWKQSVRHHLSLNRLFERQPRPVTDPGFGSYWTVNLSAPPGTKRPRKRGRPNKDGTVPSTVKKSSNSKSQESPTSQHPPAPTKFQFQPQSHPPPPLPPIPQPQISTLSPHPSNNHLPPQSIMQTNPGQPLRPQSPQQINIIHKGQFQAQIIPQMHLSQLQPPPPPPPQSNNFSVHAPIKSPGQLHSGRQHEMQHPGMILLRKPSTPLTPASGKDSTRPSSKSSETEDSSPMAHDEEPNGPTVSESEFESEEELIPHPNRRQSRPGAFVPTRPSPIFSLPPFSVMDQNRDDIIEHMRQEIATLRRTSAEAVSTSIRLTEQLANANLEVSRSREAVRDLEDMLQREVSSRKEAERGRDLEMERRRAAENALSMSALANRSPNNSRSGRPT